MKLIIYIFIFMALSLCCVCLAHSDDSIVIRTIIAEAGGEPYEGQVAVARVIKNRMEERSLSAEQVVLQPYQFSCWRVRTGTELHIAGDAWSDTKTDLGKIADATLYHHYKVTPNWDMTKVKYLGQIGKHKFYKEITAHDFHEEAHRHDK